MSTTNLSHDSAILAAARELFAENGYDAVSTSMIAERAGVSKANVYHHYQSKEELYLAVLRDACEEVHRSWADVLTADAPATQRLQEFARRHLAHVCSDSTHSRLLIREISEHGSCRAKTLAREVFGARFSELVAVVKQGQEREELRADFDPALGAMLLLAANVSFFQWRDIMGHLPGIEFPEDTEFYARHIVDIVLNGIARDARGRTGIASEPGLPGEPGAISSRDE